MVMPSKARPHAERARQVVDRSRPMRVTGGRLLRYEDVGLEQAETKVDVRKDGRLMHAPLLDRNSFQHVRMSSRLSPEERLAPFVQTDE